MNVAAPLAIGDFLPDIRLVDQDGAAVPLYHQSIAGDPVVLLLLPQRIELAGEALAALADEAARFATAPVHLFAVSPSGIESHRAAVARRPDTWPPTLRLLADPARKLLGAFGDLPGPRLAVLRPNLRLAALLDGADAVTQALRLCREMVSGDGPIVASQAPVLIVDSVFPPSFCRDLMQVWDRGSKSENRVSGDHADYAQESMKRRSDVILEDAALGRTIQEHLTRRLLPEMAKAFHFQVSEAERYRIGCYDAGRGDYFRRHRDLGTAQTRHRAYALSLNLSDDYTGGELLFPEYGAARYRPPAGGAVVFSCALLHEALPVKTGRRFALFTFFSGRSVTVG